MLHFVDRRKNIIRRSGENIAAAEVEALLQAHPQVAQAAVLAVPDEMREEEVLACVVLRSRPRGAASGPRARGHSSTSATRASPTTRRRAGSVVRRQIPTTGTQKIQKHPIFPQQTDPRSSTA